MILVVDDNVDTADLLVRMLRRTGLEADAVRSGFDALQYLGAETIPLPHLVILDVTMPGIDGIECLRAIRDERRWDEVPVIMHTADFGMARMQEALRLGAAGYVVKGVMGWGEFLSVIEQHRRRDSEGA